MIRFPTLLLACLAACPVAGAGEFRLEDAHGDDFGAGDIVYPNRDDFSPGSLDLERLSVRPAADGTWFRARMGQAIADPAGRVSNVGGEPLDKLARHDFHTFNIDIYIDTDRVAGSGRSGTLPGRVVDVSRETAWEKAVILTPRPEVARAWYAIHLAEVRQESLRAEKGKVEKDDVALIEAAVEEEIAEHYFFPNRIRVRNREIEFFVPATFLGGPAQEKWAYTVLVTGADVEQAGRMLNFSPGSFTLMVMGLAPGRATERFGIINRGDVNQPPVVDLLASSVDAQKRALSDYDVVAPRLATVAGVSPAGGGPASGPAAAAPAARPPPPAPATKAGDLPEAGQADVVRRRTVASRLKTLNALRDEGLVSEEEYRQLRRKILGEI